MSQIILKDTGNIICANAVIAESFMQRLVGLLGRFNLPADEALVFYNAPSIHMFFMKIPLDIIYLDKHMKIVKLVKDLKPWQMSSCYKAKVTIEASVGLIERCDLRLGQTLIIA
ncbi:MAG: DUF192 domain-containing protein [Candidatus Omnitrophica bacterium]|nr:DUF192 domain-containing protein [Candidatus Omnitrophota bacterium]MDD5440774.1 DUF192 domain-containing protein [Candidatus Omnitrophota bacterium]